MRRTWSVAALVVAVSFAWAPAAVAAMNDGQNIVNHNGHANTTVLSIGGSALYRSDFDGLTNAPRYGLFYSMGCWSAAIDKDCIAEHWNNSPNGGGAFYIGNSRYGWGSPGNPGYGTGDEFDREFFNALFNQGLEHAGVAHAAHKDAFVDVARWDGYTRYTLYELNLLGDPDQLEALTEFLVDIDMMPIHILTGTKDKKFEKRIKELTADVPHEVNVKSGGDMLLFHQWIKNEPVDLIMGNTYCKYIAKDEDIPYVRFGFPILDRMGHSYFSTMGYRGAMRLIGWLTSVEGQKIIADFKINDQPLFIPTTVPPAAP